ncbi:hypothetical protein [Massilia sp. METH4]|uniref:hypothetical protein n=1 Tax=Massilia sp. METH4 TaxID=3123041 RepID=UPI0030CE96D8
MRLHISSPDFHAALLHCPAGAGWQTLHVLLNDVEQEHVIMADEEQGRIVQYVPNGAGKFAPEPGTRHPPTRVLHGDVQIILPEWWPQ